MAGAVATLVPTMYVEPFGGVAVEAMMAGCPALTTDWGAFTETVEEGVSGYRFRSLREGVAAVEAAAELDRERVRARAEERYSLEAVAPLYERWFSQLGTLRGAGWYER
jgi:glycosyltransferase involved in cell wall biosynthesis